MGGALGPSDGGRKGGRAGSAEPGAGSLGGQRERKEDWLDRVGDWRLGGGHRGLRGRRPRWGWPGGSDGGEPCSGPSANPLPSRRVSEEEVKEGAPGALPGPGVGVRGREQTPPFLPAGSWGIPAPHSVPSSRPATGLGLVSSPGFESGGRKGGLYKTQSTPKGIIGTGSKDSWTK